MLRLLGVENVFIIQLAFANFRSWRRDSKEEVTELHLNKAVEIAA